MNRQFCALLLATVTLVLISACGGSDSSNHHQSGQLSQFDTRIPDAIAQHVPMPGAATIRMSMAREDGMSVMFVPGISWPDSLAFFAEGLTHHGWIIQEEEMPTETEGEREARWTATGHGHSLRLSLTTYGGEQGFNMTGVILIQEAN